MARLSGGGPSPCTRCRRKQLLAVVLVAVGSCGLDFRVDGEALWVEVLTAAAAAAFFDLDQRISEIRAADRAGDPRDAHAPRRYSSLTYTRSGIPVSGLRSSWPLKAHPRFS